MGTTTLALAFLSATQTFNLPPGMLAAVCYVESKHVVQAINVGDGGSDSFGICQLKLSTAQGMGYSPTTSGTLQASAKINTFYAAKYLRYQLDRYKGNTWRAIAAYNSGTFKVNKQGQTINKAYVDKVFRAWAGIK